MIDQAILQKAVEASIDGVVITDAQQHDNPIIYVNPAFERMTGYALAEVKGTNCRFMQGPESDQKELAILREAIAARRACVLTLRNYRKDRSAFYNELSISPITDTDGKLTHYIGIQKDVTRRIIAEMRTREYQKRLRNSNIRLRELSIHDSLTHIYNRRHFDSLFSREWQIAKRENTPLAVIMCDIDYFKNFNDTYGHQAGDQCLIQCAQALLKGLNRAGDTVARYGGEEFIILLRYCDHREAGKQAQSACERVKSLEIRHETSDVSDIVTISSGAASLIPSHCQKPHDLIKMADDALYEAKSRGRDRVVIN
ncbi:MAG: diguanylate cyclase [Chitinivibrionales bacterium]|nr:diguanylate cyclase [Chitinivibrionales bacterium]